MARKGQAHDDFRVRNGCGQRMSKARRERFCLFLSRRTVVELTVPLCVAFYPLPAVTSNKSSSGLTSVGVILLRFDADISFFGCVICASFIVNLKHNRL